MSREEEIQEAIKDIHKSIDCNGLACWQCIKLSIGKGISWADQHPKEGLWDSGKVIKWLRANVDNYANYNVKTDECFVNDFEEDLIKAMEEKP